MNRPLWQRARKNFIRLVDDDKIPETHKRLNLHYLRRLPYYAISTEPPIIVEEPQPELEPQPQPELEPEPVKTLIRRGFRLKTQLFVLEYMRDFTTTDLKVIFGIDYYNDPFSSGQCLACLTNSTLFMKNLPKDKQQRMYDSGIIRNLR